MSNYNVSTRYARAFLMQTEENGSFAKAAEDIELMFNTFSSSKELRVMLASPVLKSQKKKEILTEIFADKVSAETLEFLLFILEKSRIDHAYSILERFIELRDNNLGIVKMQVASAVELEDAQKKQIEAKFTEVVGKKVNVNYSIDESLIGGFTARFGDTVYDASVKNQFLLLKNKFMREN